MYQNLNARLTTLWIKNSCKQLSCSWIISTCPGNTPEELMENVAKLRVMGKTYYLTLNKKKTVDNVADFEILSVTKGNKTRPREIDTIEKHGTTM